MDAVEARAVELARLIYRTPRELRMKVVVLALKIAIEGGWLER